LTLFLSIDIIEDERPIFLGLVDLLYCYAYNIRTTLGRSRAINLQVPLGYDLLTYNSYR